MKRHRGLSIVAFLPALTMLGSCILMNDRFEASRRGMLSVLLMFFGLVQLILFAFFIGFRPETNGAALRLGGMFFFSFALFFLVRMADCYQAWAPPAVVADTPFLWLQLPLIAIGASVLLFLLGLALSQRRRRVALEASYENN